MARYFGGNSLAAFFRTDVGTAESTVAGTFDSTYVSNSIRIDIGQLYSTLFSATGTVWVGLEWKRGNAPFLTGPPIIQLNGSGTGIFRLLTTNNTQTVTPQYWNGSAWTNTGNTFSAIGNNAYIRLAVKIVLGSGFEVYFANSLTSSGSGWTGSMPATATQLVLSPAGSWDYFSQVMVADYDLRDSRLKDPLITGNSAANVGAASGVYTDVNEIVLNDSTAINIQTSGNKAGQTKTAISVPVGYVIGGMVVNARGRVSGGTITDGKLGIRSGGTNYSSAGKAYNPGYEPRSHISEVDPATGVRFTQAGFNAAEPYLEAS